MKMMIGELRIMKMTNGNFVEAYSNQIAFQEKVTGLTCPSDYPDQLEYQMCAMVEELGEVLKADKRWKTHRNTAYIHDEKVDEIADVFIVAMNVAIYSGMTAEELMESVNRKIAENFERLNKVQ